MLCVDLLLSGENQMKLFDNAMQFKLANEVTNLVWGDVIKCDEVQSYFSKEKIKWRYIVELAPWMGGFYERLVGLIRRCLKKCIGRNLLVIVYPLF